MDNKTKTSLWEGGAVPGKVLTSAAVLPGEGGLLGHLLGCLH